MVYDNDIIKVVHGFSFVVELFVQGNPWPFDFTESVIYVTNAAWPISVDNGSCIVKCLASRSDGQTSSL